MGKLKRTTVPSCGVVSTDNVASPPAVWSGSALMIEAKQADGRTVRPIVYRDAAAAAAARQQAYAETRVPLMHALFTATMSVLNC